jgi:MOSC domain-containing protein YiiM
MEVAALGIADQPGRFVTRAIDLAVLSYAGLEGDLHAGLTMKAGVRQKHLKKGTEIRNARQLSLVSDEELAQISRALGVAPLDYRWFGANLLVRGQPGFTKVGPGTRLVFASGAVLCLDGDNDPCTKTGRAVAAGLGLDDETFPSRFVKAAMGLRGLVGWVERPGTIRAGDAVTVVPR